MKYLIEIELKKISKANYPAMKLVYNNNDDAIEMMDNINMGMNHEKIIVIDNKIIVPVDNIARVIMTEEEENNE